MTIDLVSSPVNSTDVQAIIHTPGLVELIKASPFFKVDFVNFHEEKLSEGALKALFFLCGQTFTLNKELVFLNVTSDKIRYQVLGVVMDYLSPIKNFI
ncbi:hypothetical protein GYA13_02130 [Candidatus Kuenenbacteria bacterium]|nr:hypothetical protein [Candidatus Kuenenbacteria bacterium]